MSIHVALNHRTGYQYDRLVTLSPQIVRLRPAPHSRTRILSYSQKILPSKHFINWQQDPHGNYQARLVFPEKTRSFSVEIDLVIEMAAFNAFDFFLEPDAEHYPFRYAPALKKDLTPFLETPTPSQAMKTWLSIVPLDKIRTIDFLVALNQRIQKDIGYIIRMEPGVQTPEETLLTRKGSCRDSSWLLIHILRNLGFAARFVSGYLVQLTADEKSLDGPSGPEKDFTDLHAWVEVYLPGAGWIGFDPTSGLLASEGHIPLACTPEPSSAAPVSGGVDECKTEFDFAMSVQRIYESPRVTKPYTEEEWEKIEALGHKIDQKLTEGDVRLTMGGEPTFVSIDDMDGPEWNITALSPKKRQMGAELIRRLKHRFAPGAMLHFGQGKWYPGESLPRWAFGCFWRKDGYPIWENDQLIADEKVDYGMGIREARQFMFQLTKQLELDSKYCIPGYEDSWYYLWKERRLPVNVDPLRSKLEDAEERARLAKIFEQGLDKVIGYALPIQRGYLPTKPVWLTGPWFMRPQHMFLIPGDSPMGFRLPLDSLGWVAPWDYPWVNELDPTIERTPLPPRMPRGDQRHITGGESPSYGPYAGLRRGSLAPHEQEEMERKILEEAKQYPAHQESASSIVRTALCVEPRNGRLHVFMPPTTYLEDYLDLVTAVENTSADLNMPVLLEGYTPPGDPRLNVIKVTPDPGVIEVNIHPTASWDEAVKTTTGIYEEARLTRLGTEKFMLDGRHTGTGGGNHIILGGATPLNSPFLRRPDLLQSLLSYWNNHPSLSYLFSGLFIGPTSQAPRVDEGRADAIHELELAFKQLPRKGEANIEPWRVDRVLRNFLIDLTGNTHRSEFCIDKLYSPDSSTGRLGLLEMRAFEMPPHARMSLTQQLLIRSFLARFWADPYRSKLVHWGTELYDRFMLPHFVRQDFEDVITDMQDYGVPLEAKWFDPHFEFKFPLHGDISRRGVQLELRHALEPWHVLGEESFTGGTARYVDSTLERVQVKVQGMTASRHVVTCNGRVIPLYPTGTNGEFVAGVRYRAWQAPSCLHPTIPIHAPLTFDIIDNWSERSIGGCVYHVDHPGGVNPTTFPANAVVAESRRLGRFFRFGHTPNKIKLPEERTFPEHPFTLDLRHPPLT